MDVAKFYLVEFKKKAWKYSLLKSIKKEMVETRDIGKIIKKVMVKGHEAETPKIVQQLVKDLSKMPLIILNQDLEWSAYEKTKTEFEKEFGCQIELIKSEKSKEPKAKQAMPGKPAILVQ